MTTVTAPAAPRADASEHPNQFALLRQRRFAPFFWTQFSGAANDNLFKFAFTVMVTYQLQVGWMPPALAGLVIGALFILPFLLFSATSGQLTWSWYVTITVNANLNRLSLPAPRNWVQKKGAKRRWPSNANWFAWVPPARGAMATAAVSVVFKRSLR